MSHGGFRLEAEIWLTLKYRQAGRSWPQGPRFPAAFNARRLMPAPDQGVAPSRTLQGSGRAISWKYV